jgi:hypothetical protein
MIIVFIVACVILPPLNFSGDKIDAAIQAAQSKPYKPNATSSTSEETKAPAQPTNSACAVAESTDSKV